MTADKLKVVAWQGRELFLDDCDWSYWREIHAVDMAAWDWRLRDWPTRFEKRALVLQSEAQAALDAALERVKVLEAEAAKYRWMADRYLGADFDWNESGKSVLLIEIPDDAKVWGDLGMTVATSMAGKGTTE